ncbi:hypothetical protein E5161_15225 [Cohnella pontilimi]|uniref:Uncharacterized protein n=1 Tax=Cohnella pontilimi TaxID=2564100 RepID=A0A4U0F8J5_9BACL|nr:DUF2161 family putative PD-(D/E)XK-type phosphodiesterase [Cohnella pontilimi]TJY41056.1 hypothetical protein E5161_15225 [Cohnella pontilimi]
MAVSRETELYPPVKAFFTGRGYEVKAEIGGCDLFAVRADEPEPTIVEMKKTFTLPLLLQGIDRQKTGAVVWLAVERNRTKRGAHNQRFTELTALCRRLRLGFMTVTFYKTKPPVVEVWCEPGNAAASAALAAAETSVAYTAAAAADPLPTGRARKRASRLLKEFQGRSGDYNVGGSTGRKLVTAYRERSLQCALALLCHGPSSPRHVRDRTSLANTGSLLRDNVYGWFAKVDKGVYRLTPKGEQALQEYADITAVWASKFSWAADWQSHMGIIDPEEEKDV